MYVGETETMLKDQIQNHLSDIRTFKKYNRPVSIHFNSKDHVIDDFRYAGIDISRKITQYIDRPVNHCLLKCVALNKRV